MKKLALIVLILICSYYIVSGQVLRGRIVDKSGVPVQYATVYIQELKQGTTSNAKGDYEIRLKPGVYVVVYQSLGYEPVYENIKISDESLIKNVTLPEQIYKIPEVVISPSGEDPAVSIMRKVIGLAPYYLNFIEHYKAEVYLKGNLLMKKIPKIFQKSMRMNQSEDNVSISAGKRSKQDTRTIKEGDSFMMESFNEIEFSAPDKYVQRVISFNSSFPEEGNEVSPMDFIQASFYQPVIAEMAISPLSPQAFSHYIFRYQGATLEGNYVIDKIEVIPRRKSQQLFEGTIYIIEDLWCLHSVDLSNENIAGKIRVRELYIPVKEEVWMPVSHQIDVDLQILGIRADAGYASSVKYLDVTINERLQKPLEIVSGVAARNVPDTAQTRASREIDRLLQKDELSRRDMVRLANMMEKETSKSRNDSSAKSLEIKETTQRIVEKDAGKKDSSYWAEIRPIPLSEKDIRSLAISDSIRKERAGITQQRGDSTISQGGKRSKKFGRTLNNIFLGHTWSDTSGFSFTNGGLINLRSLSFNTVDGFIYGIDFRLRKSFKNNNSIGFYPDIRYAFSRGTLLWRINANYSIAGMKPKQIYLRTGMTSKDLNQGTGINILLNSLSSLLFEKNYLKVYESNYFTLGYKTEIVNGLDLDLSTGFDDRKVLENTTSFSIIKTKNEYTSNIPDNQYLKEESYWSDYLNDQKHLEFTANISYTPFRKYHIYNGNKSPAGSDWPTFSILWKYGVNHIVSVSDEYLRFNMLKFEIYQKLETGAFSDLTWRLRTGGFIDNSEVPFFDFFHFNSQPIYLTIDNYEDAFMLPQFYSQSSPRFFGEIHLKYTTPYLLLKLLPGLSNTLIRENVSFSYLGKRYEGSYFEIGYSLSEIFLIGQAGIFLGFNDLRYNSIGIRFNLRLN